MTISQSDLFELDKVETTTDHDISMRNVLLLAAFCVLLVSGMLYCMIEDSKGLANEPGYIGALLYTCCIMLYGTIIYLLARGHGVRPAKALMWATCVVFCAAALMVGLMYHHVI